MLRNEYLQNSSVNMKILGDSTYKLFETYEERQLRIEANYLRQKLEELELETALE